MPTETVLADYQLDEACLIVGRQIENRLNEGKPAFDDEKPKKMRSLRSRATKRVKIKNGTW